MEAGDACPISVGNQTLAQYNRVRRIGVSTLELRRKTKKQLDHLSVDRLQSAADFIDFLDKKHGNGSERDPRIARMRLRIREADEAEAAGKLIPWDKLKRKR